MEQSHSLKADSRSDTPSFPDILWNTKAYYHDNKSFPLISILGQIN
jgi:hypothetical protein